MFEGLDGSGKSSLMKCLEKELTAQGHRVQMTREPGGTPLSEEIRELILRCRPTGEAPSARAELLLYQAARHQHVARVIKPALAQGVWVLCDRFTASSLAFQGQGRDLSWESVEWLNAFATEDLIPELQILIDVPLEVAQLRMQKRSTDGASPSQTEKDRIESESSEFHNRVRQGFLRQAKTNAAGWLVLNGEQSLQELTALLKTEFAKRNWLTPAPPAKKDS